MKTYVVTGGTGFVGSALVQRLAREGHRVRVLDDNSRGAARRLHAADGLVEFIASDVRDSLKVREAIRGADCVFHLAYVN